MSESVANYVIDRAAGESDIRKLNQAKERLENASQTLIRLQQSAEGMSSDTTKAIAEKCIELQKRINFLNGTIDDCTNYIQDAITGYLSVDESHAENMKR